MESLFPVSVISTANGLKPPHEARDLVLLVGDRFLEPPLVGSRSGAHKEDPLIDFRAGLSRLL